MFCEYTLREYTFCKCPIKLTFETHLTVSILAHPLDESNKMALPAVIQFFNPSKIKGKCAQIITVSATGIACTVHSAK
jgi:hypothetical protein